MASHAIIHGLNYENFPNARLHGCDTDAHRLEKLVSQYVDSVETHTEYNQNTGVRIVDRLHHIADWTQKENVETVIISFSGHGVRSQGTESICPSDFRANGTITDKHLHEILCKFHEKTTVYLIMDCCHSGDILNLRYRWVIDNNDCTCIQENECYTKPEALCISLSGCRKEETSADAYNVLDEGKFGGALTSCLVEHLESLNEIDELPTVFHLVRCINKKIHKKEFDQTPVLSSNIKLCDNHQIFS